MRLRERLFNASKKATEISEAANTKQRVTSGYARVDPLELAEQAGVVVMARPLDRLLGAFLREDRSGILLNSERPVGMVHMTCAHELGHFHLGHLSTADEHVSYGTASEASEQEANQFAYQLLIPLWLVTHAMRRKGWGRSDLLHADVVYQLSLRLGVSYSAMVWGLHRLKMLPPAEAGAMAAIQPKLLKQYALSASEANSVGNSDVWMLDIRDKDWVIEPRSTDRFMVQLPSHATAGYLWTADELRGEGFTLKPVTVDIHSNPARRGPPRVGGSASDLYLLNHADGEASSNERTSAHLLEGQPWDGDSPPNNQVALAMEFEHFSIGLSKGTKAREVRHAE